MKTIRDEIAEKEKRFFHQRRTLLHALAASHGLYIGQLPILEYILNNQGCTQSEVAAKMGVSPASIAASTRRLQRTGMIYKRTNMDNLRCKQLFVTPKGQEIAQTCRTEMDQLQAKIFEALSDDELTAYGKTLEILGERISEVIESFISSQESPKNQSSE